MKFIYKKIHIYTCVSLDTVIINNGSEMDLSAVAVVKVVVMEIIDWN